MSDKKKTFQGKYSISEEFVIDKLKAIYHWKETLLQLATSLDDLTNLLTKDKFNNVDIPKKNIRHQKGQISEGRQEGSSTCT